MDRSRVASLAIVGLALCACRLEPPVQTGAAAHAGSAAVEPTPRAHEPPQDSTKTPARDAYSDLAPLTETLAHRRVGFSADDAYLAYQISTCDPCPSEFHLVSPRKPQIDLTYWYHPEHNITEDEAERRREANDAAVTKKLDALGIGEAQSGRALRGPFPYPDLRFATRSSEDASTTTLHFGARVDDEEPVYAMTVTLAYARGLVPRGASAEDYAMSGAELAYANVTRDGRDIGVVAVGFGPYWFEAGGVARMPVSAFVAKVYAETGRRHLAANQYARAAALLGTAHAAQPDDAGIARDLEAARRLSP